MPCESRAHNHQLFEARDVSDQLRIEIVAVELLPESGVVCLFREVFSMLSF
jgi:hypothetical protein